MLAFVTCASAVFFCQFVFVHDGVLSFPPEHVSLGEKLSCSHRLQSGEERVFYT